MKKVLPTVIGLSLLGLTSGCITSQFRPIAQTTSVRVSADSVTIFLLERDLPAVMERLGTVTIHTYGSTLGIHQKVDDEIQKVGRQKGANGAFRVAHGTYDHDKDGLITYLLFRYTNP